MSEIVALGLDPSMRNTGWAVGWPGMTRPKFGVYEQFNWAHHEGESLWAFADWLIEMFVTYHFTHVFAEQSFLPSGKDRIDIRGAQLSMLYRTAEISARMGVPFRIVNIDDWRGRAGIKPPKGLKGNTRRSWLKGEAIRRCRARGWYTENDNAAEAMLIMEYGIASIDPVFASQSDPLFQVVQ